MNQELIEDLRSAISKLKQEIIEKQNKLDELIDQYQQISGIELEEETAE